MKKLAISAAVAAMLGAPAAMADIVMGGQLEFDLVNASGDGTNDGLYLSDAWEKGAPNKGSGSHFWVKGAHKLGGNLKGIWKLNTVPLWDNGNTFALGRRDAFVGLSGGFGTVVFGRQNSPYKAATVKWDPFLATFLQARGNEGMSGLHNSYVDNAIAYANKFGKASFAVAVGLDESDDNPADGDLDGDHAVTAMIKAPVGPVELALAYIDTGGISTFVVDTSDLKAVKVGAKFKSGPIGLAAQYEMIDKAGDAFYNQMYVTGGYTFGKNTLAASYGSASPDDGTLDDATYFAVGLKHAFSKKLTATVGTTSTENLGFDATKDYSVSGVSMRVKF